VGFYLGMMEGAGSMPMRSQYYNDARGHTPCETSRSRGAVVRFKLKIFYHSQYGRGEGHPSPTENCPFGSPAQPGPWPRSKQPGSNRDHPLKPEKSSGAAELEVLELEPRAPGRQVPAEAHAPVQVIN
jgi:hypothetical protein